MIEADSFCEVDGCSREDQTKNDIINVNTFDKEIVIWIIRKK